MDALDHNFTVTVASDSVDAAKGIRNLTMVVHHPGIIWTSELTCLRSQAMSLNLITPLAIAFDAHVLKWTLDNNPPNEFARHHIKEASFHGTDVWSVDLSIKIPETPSWSTANGKIRVDFVGIHEKAMWPGKKAEKEEGGRAMVLFEEFDNWVEKEYSGKIDTTLLGCAGGVAWV